MKLAGLLGSALISLLAACATTQQAPPTTTLSGGKGLMIVSLTLTPTRGHPLHWELHDLAKPDRRLLYLVGYAGTSREDWGASPKMGGFGGRLIVQELPPGEYQLRTWRFTELQADRRTFEYFPKAYLQLNFRVEPGRAVYLGNLHLHAEQGAKRFPLAVFDARERDLALFHQRYGAIPPAQVDIRLLPAARPLPAFLRTEGGSAEEYRALVELLTR